MKYYETVTLSLMTEKCDRVLDFGCGDGSFCKLLLNKSKHVYGCDLDKDLIAKARKTVGKVKFSYLKMDGKTSYPDNYFDCVFMMGVLEHVADENSTLTEIRRILKPRGFLYIYGINKGLLGFLDAGNLKFVFPKLHKRLYYWLSKKELYQKEFVAKKKSGMFGDFTLGRKWHSHYSRKDLNKLFGGRYKISKVKYFGLFIPILLPIKYLYDFKYRKPNRPLEKAIILDQKISSPTLSYLFVAKCKKVR